jgi:hypothetical protein
LGSCEKITRVGIALLNEPTWRLHLFTSVRFAASRDHNPMPHIRVVFSASRDRRLTEERQMLRHALLEALGHASVSLGFSPKSARYSAAK